MGLPDARKSATASRTSLAFAQPVSTNPTSSSTAEMRLSAFAFLSCVSRLVSEFGLPPKKRLITGSTFVKSGSSPSTLRTSTLLSRTVGSLSTEAMKSATASTQTSTSASTAPTMMTATFLPRDIAITFITYPLRLRLSFEF